MSIYVPCNIVSYLSRIYNLCNVEIFKVNISSRFHISKNILNFILNGASHQKKKEKKRVFWASPFLQHLHSSK